MNSTTKTERKKKIRKNEWDLLQKLLPFLENNERAIVHILFYEKNKHDYKTWGIVRFKKTNFIAESSELEKILHILEDKFKRKVYFNSKKNKIYIEKNETFEFSLDFQKDFF